VVATAGGTAPPPPFPRTFAIVLFVAAAIVAGIVTYFGVTGHLGAGVP
jgi:hypothetical protein